MLDRDTPRTVPSDAELQAGLRALALDGAWSELVLLEREVHVHASTNVLEVVTCRLPVGRILRLVCKHHPGWTHPSFGHRGGIPLEARVYREFLEPLSAGTPGYHGYVTLERRGWL